MMIINLVISFYDLLLTYYLYLVEYVNNLFPKDESTITYINYNIDIDRMFLSNNDNKITIDRKLNVNMKDLFNFLGTSFTSPSSLMSFSIIDDENKEIDITSYANKIIEIRKKFNILNETRVIDMIPENNLKNSKKIKEISLMNEMFDEHKLDYILNTEKLIVELI